MTDKPKIKILHVITDLNTGGAEMSLYRLISCADRTMFENHVVSLIPVGDVGEKIRMLGIPVSSLGMKPGLPSLRAFHKLTNHMRHERFDIIQTWLYHADLLGLLAARGVGISNVVWNIRNSNIDMSKYRRLSGMVLRACAWLSEWPQAVVCNSRAGQEFHASINYHPKRWVLIPNGIDLSGYKPDPSMRLSVRQELGISPDSFLIGMAARYDPMKDYINFLKAAAFLTRSGLNVNFILVGQNVNPDNVDLSGIVQQEGLSGRTHMLGRRSDMPRLYAALDVFSLTSLGEGFPNVIAEAMACGVPCAVTGVGDSALIVGETGRIVPPRDPEALAKAWTEILSLSPGERQSLGLMARQRIIDHYSLDRMVSAYCQLYQDIIAELK
jgi:glycosyltransferase involved in cell wall biosynthesis